MTRLISGVLLAAVALAAILFLPLAALRVLAAIVAAFAAREYLSITVPSAGARHLVMAIIVALVCWVTSGTTGATLFGVVALTLGWLAYSVLFANQRIHDAASEIVAAVYIGVPLGMLVAGQILAGWQATLVLMGTVVVSDSAQYYTGRAFGRRQLAPAISPKKTMEGAVGGVVFGIVFMVVAGAYVFPLLGVPARALLGAVVVVLGILGDLFESRLKRVAGVKDSSSLIPGHGGILDRIDALLFAIPAFYFMLVRSAV
jgi:phosphatidate cytidylyltransferase